ncbi:MAG: cytochrome P450 [Ktedonobacterales bacterium]
MDITDSNMVDTAGAEDWFDFFDAGFRLDPYRYYRRLREEDPLHWGVSFEPTIPGMWHVARYADIISILKDPRFVHQLQSEEHRIAVQKLPEETQLYLSLKGHSLLFADPPTHTRLRSLVSKAFTPRMVESLRPRVHTIADKLLDDAETGGEIDVVNDYAIPLTSTIISEMLGISIESREQLMRWAGVLVRALDCKQSPAIYVSASQVALELYAFFQNVVSERRHEPARDILSELIRAQDQQDQLSEPELIVMATTLLIAGFETTVNLIGNGMLALMTNPSQLDLLRKRPELTSSAIEEFLRYDASSQMTSRMASEDISFGGKTIGKGQTLNLLLGSGNRDPEVFTDPERLDITRAEKPHLSFGMGMHYCLGAPLARLEGQVAVQTLLCRYPHLRLSQDLPRWRDTISFRGLEGLPLAI